MFYIGKVSGGEIRPSDETSQVGFFYPEECPPVCFSSHQEVLQKLFDWEFDVPGA
jgi:hypothetical protein